jgi:excinuclease UvrABC ATPase subunit
VQTPRGTIPLRPWSHADHTAPETIAIADHVVDLGLGACAAGGTVCFEGTVEGLRTSGTLTGRHLDDRAALKETVRTPEATHVLGPSP